MIGQIIKFGKELTFNLLIKLIKYFAVLHIFTRQLIFYDVISTIFLVEKGNYSGISIGQGEILISMIGWMYNEAILDKQGFTRLSP